MKKIILLGFAFVFGTAAFAQTCIRDASITSPGTYPSSLPKGQGGLYYEQVIQFRIPADTSVDFNGQTVQATVDSIKVKSVLGLPGGLNYNCNPASCALPGGETSCGVIYGTIANNAAGNYPFVIPIAVYGKIGGSFPLVQNDTIFNLSMDVDPYNSVVRQESEVKVYPNPSSNQVSMVFPESINEVELKVVDAGGKEVQLQYSYILNRVETDLSALPTGVYFATAIRGNNIYHFRLVRN